MRMDWRKTSINRMEKTPTTKRIVLIDDDQVTNMINRKLITREFNVAVSTYTNAQEALSDIAIIINSSTEELPDLILLDINMPVMDGWEFLTEFQKIPIDPIDKCKVFMLTSSIDLDDIKKSKTFTSVSDFISKPLTVEKLHSLIPRDQSKANVSPAP
jgi:CheY-like chemotaxis protein